MKLNRTPSLHDRDWRNAENENWDVIEGALSDVFDVKDEIEGINYEALQLLRDLRDGRITKPTFESGTVRNDGSLMVSGDRLRTQNIIELKSGDVISPYQDSDFEYSLMLYDNGVFREGWGRGWFLFGESQTVYEDVGAIVIIRRVDGADMHNDVEEVERHFKIDRQQGAIKSDQIGEIMEILKSAGLVSRVALDLNLEVGSVSYNGEFIHLTNRARSNRIVLLSSGGTVTTKDNPKYEYSLMYYGNTNESSFESGWGLGYFTFGTYDHTMENTKGVVPVIRRVDLQDISESDIEEIKRDFTIESFVPNQESQGKMSTDKFNVSGQMNNLMTIGINDFIPDPDGGLTPQQFHDMTIDLVNTHSELTDYELHGQDAYGYNMYSYEIKPHVMRNSTEWNTTPTGNIGTPLEIPKIIITGGIHGSERNANYVVYYFMNALLNNPDNIETFDTLAQNVHFVFMPMCCPSGFVDNSYENRASMNLNRDFGPYGDFEHPESQHVKALIDKHSDADLHIDYHNFTPQDGKLDILGYALTDVDELKRLTTNTYKYVGRQMQLKDTRYPQSRIHQWAYTADANEGTMGKYSNVTHGIPSSIVETPKSQLFFDEVDHGKTVTQLGVDVLSNVIISFMNARK